jgi:hypothetical protein
MRMRIGLVVVLVTCVTGVAFGQWTQLATNPSWFPYGDFWGTPPTIGVDFPQYAPEPLGLTVGYLPRSLAAGVLTNGKYYLMGGWGATLVQTDPADPNVKRTWWENRESGTDIYDFATGTWSSSKWDGTGPRAIVTNPDLGATNGPGFAWEQYFTVMDPNSVPPAGSGSTATVANRFDIWDVKASGQSLRYQWRYDEAAATLTGLITKVALYENQSGVYTEVKTLWAGAAGDWLSSFKTQLSGLWKSTDATQPLTAAHVLALAQGRILVIVHTDLYPDGEVAGIILQGANWNPNRLPSESMGSRLSAYAGHAFDRNGDGINELYVVPGYPHWGGNVSIYDPADNTWVPGAWQAVGDTGLLTMQQCPSVLYNGKIYALAMNYQVGKSRVYDIATDLWSRGNELLTYETRRAAVVTIGSTAYLFGGLNTNKILTYDLAAASVDPTTTDVVDTGETLPQNTEFMSAVVYQGKIYLVGGAGGATGAGPLYKTAYVYDPSQPVGSRLTNLNKDFPFPISEASTVIDPATGKWYVGGGLKKYATDGTTMIRSSELYVLNLAGAPVKKGDMNCDGVVDFKDINPFVAILSGGTPCSAANADTNCDNVIDFKDINPFVALLSGGTPCAN